MPKKYKVLSIYPTPEVRERIEATAAKEKRRLAPTALLLIEEALAVREKADAHAA